MREGASVVLADINGEASERSAEELRQAGGQALGLTVDVSDQAQTEMMVAETLSRFGKITGLVNNAAIALRVRHTRAPLEEIPLDEFDRMLAVNLKGVFLCSKAVLPHMKEQGYGKIINMSSGTFFNGRENLVHYVASKGGVIAFTRVLAREAGPSGITVNSIAPGLTASETEEHDMEQFAARIPNRAIKRIEVPEDLVGAGIFFMSGESDFISGQTLVVDGGVAVH